jgi:predicted aspartyl protease
MEYFDARKSLIVVDARLHGPIGGRSLRLAIDTGASMTVVSRGALESAGYDLTLTTRRQQIVTANGMQVVPVLRVSLVAALGSERRNFSVLGHTVPPATGVDGLLGLDFLRGKQLTIDFRQGEITLE